MVARETLRMTITTNYATVLYKHSLCCVHPYLLLIYPGPALALAPGSPARADLDGRGDNAAGHRFAVAALEAPGL